MSGPTDLEDWLLDEGEKVIRKKSDIGLDSLSPFERLIYCWWVADYSMRNAGDLGAARDLYPHFLSGGRTSAEALKLQEAAFLFSMSQAEFEARYFEMFESIGGEIKAAACSSAANG